MDAPNSYWFKARDSRGTIGYISSNTKYIRVTANQSQPAVGNAVIVASVSFRTKPSLSGSRIRYLQKDERITVTSRVNNYWYAVKDSSGVTGYISSSETYVKLNAAVPQQQPPAPAPAPASQKVEQVIAAGMKYLGTSYEYGSSRSTTTTFDCSDFVRQAFKDGLNVTLPADSRGQGTYVRENNEVTTDWNKLKRGDLMFFMSYKGTSASNYSATSPFSERITHVGIYLGDGKVLHTYSKTAGGVRIDSISGKHWEYRFLFGGSAL